MTLGNLEDRRCALSAPGQTKVGILATTGTQNLLENNDLGRAQLWHFDAAMRPTPRLTLLVFLILQVFDGLLTYVAVAMLGVVGEGNILLATAMHLAGAGPALFGAKALAASCGVLLYIRGFHGVLGMLTGLYLVGAITPWLIVFHNL